MNRKVDQRIKGDINQRLGKSRINQRRNRPTRQSTKEHTNESRVNAYRFPFYNFTAPIAFTALPF